MANEKKTLGFSAEPAAHKRFAAIRQTMPTDLTSDQIINALMDAYEQRNAQTEAQEADKQLITSLQDSNAALEQQLATLQEQHAEELRRQEEALRQEMQLAINDNSQKGDMVQLRLDELQAKYDSLLERYNAATNANTELKNRITDFDNRQRGYVLSPFAQAMAEAICRIHNENSDNQWHPEMLLEDMLLRYNIERRARWFYPFVLTDSAIVALAHDINPQVQNIDQLKAWIFRQ